MIRILLDRVFDNERHYIHAAGLSTDTKPTMGIITGSKFVAVDTGAEYLFDETSGGWNEKPSGGGGDVTDVQVNGVSVLDAQGVADVPIASDNAPGVAQINQTYGVAISENGILRVFSAGQLTIKAGTNTYFPITSGHVHEAAFYGLAKAAGSNENNSTLPVGQYTDAAKSAIQAMFGISGIIAPVEDATASKPYAIGDAFLHGGALYKASAAIAAGDAIVPGTNCTQTTIIEMLKGA